MRYIKIGNDVYTANGSVRRFYCTLAAWPHSPAAFTGNRSFCETCGTRLIDNCLECGAPQCCPRCCKHGL
jgi:hypothetical protein